MRFQFLEIHLKLLIYLAKHPKSVLNDIKEYLNVNYRTVHRMVGDYITQGIIIRIRKEPLLLGGDRYEYELTERGITFLKELRSLLDKIP